LSSHPHPEFLELCALSTTEELTAEEWRRLEEHLSSCDACRGIKQQYERVIATTIPALAADSIDSREEVDDENSSSSWSIEEAEAALMESLRTEPSPRGANSTIPPQSFRWKDAPGYAAAALLLTVFAFGGYRMGVHRGRSFGLTATLPAQSAGTPPRLDHAEVQIHPAHGAAAPSVDQTAELHRQLRLNLLEVARLEEQKKQLEDELEDRKADLDRSSQDRAEVDRQLALAQLNAQGWEEKLSSIASQKSQEAAQALAVQTRVDELSAVLREKDGEIAQDRELLRHDRDIRDLIGARDLYIAEIYDVAKTGDTQKPFGRVFYTKDKSLVFYGYDLDQQPGIKNAGTFQAWGRRGADHQHEVSLGILYQDDSSKKRWVLKVNDAATLAQIDAVFVTVEPRGGSSKPSGKPLLFTYLRLDPNHP
jgi:Anti-sigma-K factor rskA